jgi:hypothetical protein
MYNQFESSDDGAARHGDTLDFLVGRAGKIRNTQEWVKAAA